MIRSFIRLIDVEPGFEAASRWRMSVTYPTRLYPTAAHFDAALQDLRGRLAASPGITSIGVMAGLPPRREPNRSTYRVEGRAVDPQAPGTLVDFVQICDAGFFEVLGVRLVEGRYLSAEDTAQSLPVAVVNESFARRFFGGESPVGKRITAGGPAAGDRPWMTVVGVVGDMRQAGLHAAPGTEVFVPLTQAERTIGYLPRSVNVLVNAAAGTAAPAAMRGALLASAPDVPPLGLRTMDEVVARTVAHPRFLTNLLGAFAIGGLLLAVTGIYGVVSYLVNLRVREIGIRVALGASPRAVRRLVVTQTMAVTAVSVVAGLVAAHWSGRLLSSVLFEVDPGDPLTNVIAALVLSVSAAFAADIPARRAARLNPVEALRAE